MPSALVGCLNDVSTRCLKTSDFWCKTLQLLLEALQELDFNVGFAVLINMPLVFSNFSFFCLRIVHPSPTSEMIQASATFHTWAQS